MKTTIVLILLIVFSASTGKTQNKEYSFSEEYKVSSSAILKASTNDGFIHVYPSDENTIKVFFIVKKGSKFLKISRNELEEYLELETIHSGNKLEISVRRRNGSNWINWENQYNVALEIYAPINTACDLHSSDGDIYLQGLESDQKCKTSDGDILINDVIGQVNGRTSDGDIEVNRITGIVDLATSDGDIRVENLEGEAELQTSDGDIEIYQALASVTAQTSDGSIQFRDCSGSFTAITSDGDITGNIIKLKTKLSLRTSDGDINIRIPDGLALNLKLKGGEIDVPLIDFSGKAEEHSVQGVVRGGGIPVELSCSDGTIKLSYR